MEGIGVDLVFLLLCRYGLFVLKHCSGVKVVCNSIWRKRVVQHVHININIPFEPLMLAT